MTIKVLKVFYLDDEKSHLIVVKSAFDQLKSIKVDLYTFESPKLLFESLESGNIPDIFILDIGLKLPHENGFDVAERIRKLHPNSRIVMFSSYADRPDYIARSSALGLPLFPKQIPSQLIPQIVCDTFSHYLLSNFMKPPKTRARRSSLEAIGPTMNRFIEMIPSLINSPFKSALFVNGEVGTGKSFLLRCFYNTIPSSIPKLLIRAPIQNLSEIQNALNGWLIIDGLENIPMQLQSEILSLIKKQELKIVACHGLSTQFNPDLMLFLQQNQINLIPLRDRRPEIPLFITEYTKTYTIDTDSREALGNYSFKNGNITELKDILDQIIRYKVNRNITISDLPEHLRTAPKARTQKSNKARISIDVDLDRISFRTASNLVLLELIKALSEHNREQKRRSNLKVISDQLSFSRITILERLKEIGLSEEEINAIFTRRALYGKK